MIILNSVFLFHRNPYPPIEAKLQIRPAQIDTRPGDVRLLFTSFRMAVQKTTF